MNMPSEKCQPVIKLGPTTYASPLRWIKLTVYCQLSGDSPDAVHARRRKQQWTDGLHCKLGPDGNLWINPEEVNKWVENGESHNQKILSSPSARNARSPAHAA